MTAAARRRMDPIIWDIDGTEVRLIARTDIDLVGVLLTELQKDAPDEAGFEWARDKRDGLLKCIADFIEPDDREAFVDLSADIDIALVVEMAQELLVEYTGQGNPTEPQSSSDGSSTDGQTSTDGAPPEELTLSV